MYTPNVIIYRNNKNMLFFFPEFLLFPCVFCIFQVFVLKHHIFIYEEQSQKTERVCKTQYTL